MSGRPAGFDGAILLRKPAGVTSRHVVNQVVDALGRRDIGHAGTLDPFATGLLLVVVGRATKLVPFLHDWTKEYRAVARLGEATDTLDATGKVTSTAPIPPDTADRLRDAADSLVGPQLQVPPMFSAARVGGVRLHTLARSGASVERKPRRIVVHEMEIASFHPPMVEFRVVCSSGTYVRVLAESLGERLGVPAHLESLTRTAIGPHEQSSAMDAEELDPDSGPKGAWIPLAEVLSDWPIWSPGGADAREIRNGRVPASFVDEVRPDSYPFRCRVVSSEGDLMALVERQAPLTPPEFLRGFIRSESP